MDLHDPERKDHGIPAERLSFLQTRKQRLFISHDLRAVELISHKVAVMYLGQIVEMGPSGRIANKASHHYPHILRSSLVEKRSRKTAWKAANVHAGRGEGSILNGSLPAVGFPRFPVYESKGKSGVCIDPAREPQFRGIGGAHQAS